MCRLLTVISKKKIDISYFLENFANICERSLTPDGDRQKDGWGIITTKQFYKSINPIWEEKYLFKNFLDDKLLIAHSRSAHNSKNEIEFNQPFFDDSLIFIFNGLLRGVKINISGKIGSQKLFNLIKQLHNKDINNYWENFYQIIVKKTKLIIGMNVILIDLNLKKLNLISIFSQNEDYFSLRLYQDNEIILICSEEILNFNFQKLSSNTLITIDFEKL
ncbi:MAG: hypothetical protein KatS3mg094_526 [Candidatus Parcubacteria bacterium]|nr:MAG: hypothetical protein KatS3mg094_526 [Candidatus Parcubacteria bacterium]